MRSHACMGPCARVCLRPGPPADTPPPPPPTRQTIAGGIAKTSTFAKYPAIFMFGMLCAECGSSIWILLATYLELPVSTTHAIIGGVVGFALVFGGGNAVTW